MGTLALVASCTSSRGSVATGGEGARGEVGGVVRDRATGRVIAGARVVGADGSLAQTDAEGRFHLYVRGEVADVRVSAAGHSSEQLAIAGLETNVELAPIDEGWTITSSDVHVVGFHEEHWLAEEIDLARDAASDAAIDAGVTAASCTETSLAQAHSAIASGAPADAALVTCASCHGEGEAAASCTRCHASEARAITGRRTRARASTRAAHDGLGGGCLACHAERVARGDATRACERCHGDQASTRRAELGHFFAMAVSAVGDRDDLGTAFEMRSTDPPEDFGLTTWARALARDRSHGAHDPEAAAPPSPLR